MKDKFTRLFHLAVSFPLLKIWQDTLSNTCLNTLRKKWGCLSWDYSSHELQHWRALLIWAHEFSKSHLRQPGLMAVTLWVWCLTSSCEIVRSRHKSCDVKSHLGLRNIYAAAGLVLHKRSKLKCRYLILFVVLVIFAIEMVTYNCVIMFNLTFMHKKEEKKKKDEIRNDSFSIYWSFLVILLLVPLKGRSLVDSLQNLWK